MSGGQMIEGEGASGAMPSGPGEQSTDPGGEAAARAADSTGAGDTSTSAPAAPVVAWGAVAEPVRLSDIGQYAGGPPPFTVRALLTDTFARYGADPIRLLLVSAGASAINFAGTYASFISNPTLAGVAGTGSSNLSDLLGVLSFFVGIVAGAVTYALFEGGPQMPFSKILRRGIQRSAWMFLATLVIGLGFLAVLLLALIPGIILAFASPALFAIAIILAVLIGFWIVFRLSLAIPAAVVDNLNALDAMKLSWRVTKRAGVWLRILATSLALGLMLAPAGVGAAILLLPALFNQQPLLIVVSALILAVVTPLASSSLYSTYRRLVPPIAPSWTATTASGVTATIPALDTRPFAPVDAPVMADTTPPDVAPAAPPSAAVAAPVVGWGDPAVTAPVPQTLPGAAPTFAAPRFRTGAMAVLGLLVICSVCGLLAVSVVVGDLVAGRIVIPRFPGFPGFPGSPGFPGLEGAITPGTVAFGTGSDLSTCTVQGQTTFLRAGGQGVWIAEFTRRTMFSDEVRLRISVNGRETSNELQPAGSFDCLGTEKLETDIAPGTYLFEVLVNGRVDASGTLHVG